MRQNVQVFAILPPQVKDLSLTQTFVSMKKFLYFICLHHLLRTLVSMLPHPIRRDHLRMSFILRNGSSSSSRRTNEILFIPSLLYSNCLLRRKSLQYGKKFSYQGKILQNLSIAIIDTRDEMSRKKLWKSQSA